MLLILALVYHSQNSILATPVSAFVRDISNGDSPPMIQCSCPAQRSIWNILWGCVATIFACSWLSVHPNMPAPNEKWWKTALRRLELMFWAIIAPEMIILWAMRQWVAARHLKNLFRDQGWTKTHGYFIQMGGFTLFEVGKPIEILSSQKLKELFDEGKIQFPTITEGEINDRSKRNGLAKALAVGQTLWFLFQCIARRAYNLDITELELVTAALAILNGVMYFLWWNKPLDVETSVPVQLQESRPPVEKQITVEPPANGKFWSKETIKAIIVFPWTVVAVAYNRFTDMSTGGDFDDDKTKVPAFYSSDIELLDPSDPGADGTSMVQRVTMVSTGIAVVFGCIHCIGWYFVFPSHAELILWRVSSAVIAGLPFGITLSLFLSICAGLPSHPAQSSSFINYIGSFPAILTLLGIPVYVIARLILLVEAFATLRNLSPGSYAVVDWAQKFPHI